jgi:hypothetical protein
MLVVVLALLAVAVTAAVVIRDAHPPVPGPVHGPAADTAGPATETHPPATERAPATETAPEREPVDAPTEAIDMTQLVLPDTPPGDDGSVNAPTQSIPMPVSFAGAQAAAILPYPTSVVEPVATPAAFIPAGKPHLQPDPDRLIQTEIVIEDVNRAQTLAWTRLAIGMAVSGAVIGLGVIGIARGITLLVRALAG